MAKTIAEINEKISKGEAVVVTAEEVIDIVNEKGLDRAAQEIDVVTTGTFGPMCSSGAFLKHIGKVFDQARSHRFNFDACSSI